MGQMRFWLLLSLLAVFPGRILPLVPNPQKPVASSSERGGAIPNRQNEPRQSLWQRTTNDPVAFYTFILAIFTGLCNRFPAAGLFPSSG
jgi:hypothetical protein